MGGMSKFASETNKELQSINNYMQILGLQTSRGKNAQLFVKRLFDVVFSLMAILFLTPLFILVAILIKIESPGPVFFKQTRWGLNQKKIKVLKFRSMGVDVGDLTGVRQTVSNDPRVTRVGRVIRRMNIDELPQLINVLKGDMSIVGPRCHPVGMLAAGRLYEELVPNYHLRHLVKPGMTGLAQCRGLRGPTVSAAKAKARIALDIYYVGNFSLWLDIKTIFWTLTKEIWGGTGS